MFRLSDDEVNVLDALPGWVGHALDDCQGGKVGSVELGGPRPLRMDTVYEAYDGSAVRSRKPQSRTKNRKLPGVPV
ncbi:hypothetical protein N7471_010907 [Penicillium samsonianum]|uniref:uncharacterized protein n=1 Tax=Penicillium samsonianum TaxID=1882272 RepID=UPI002546A724|nr:uncharacterized protein N7471_010907 [Penicillium samsonianum]KAJ6123590.1 hypothetical protein N7471_010907 [Penicillium samsonianum]